MEKMPTRKKTPTRRGPGRPKVGSEDKRARILAEALSVFGEKGYEGASLTDIARAADITKPGLLHHFASKEELFIAVLDERDRLSDERGFATTEANMHAVLNTFCQIVASNSDEVEGTALFTAMTGAVVTAEHPAHSWFAGHLAHAVTTLAQAFEHGKKEGILRTEAPSWQLARALVALSDGLQAQMLCARVDAHDAHDLPYDTDLGAEFRAACEGLVRAWLVETPHTCSGTMEIAPHGHSSAHTPHPLQ